MSRPLIRVVAWNCNGKLHAKTDELLSRIPDIGIAVISECAVDVDAVGHLTKVGWTGTLPRKGLGVFARSDLDGCVDPSNDPTRQFFLPVRFRAIDLGILAVWAMNQRGEEPRPTYGRTHGAIDHYRPFLDSADLLIGDWNDNERWDTAKKPAFATTTSILDKAGFANLYYERSGENAKKESVGTLYFYRHADKPYLIDHAFWRRDRLGDIEDFAIGDPSAWLAASDHVPLVLDVARSGGRAHPPLDGASAGVIRVTKSELARSAGQNEPQGQ